MADIELVSLRQLLDQMANLPKTDGKCAVVRIVLKCDENTSLGSFLQPPGSVVKMMVDDPAGDFMLQMRLHNYPPFDYVELQSFISMLTIGKTAVLLNPRLEQIEGTLNMTLICDNPFRNLLFNHPLLEKMSWKTDVAEFDYNKLGVGCYGRNEYDFAIACFSKALAMENEPDSKKAHLLNRSAAYLANDQPHEALNDVESGLNIDNEDAKLRLCKARTLMKLERYQDCIKFLTPPTKSNQESRLLDSAKQALSEATSGKYNLLQMWQDAKMDAELKDHGSFVAYDLVEVREFPTFGRGVAAKCDLEAGTLFIAQRALSYQNDQGSFVEDNQALVAAVARKLTFRPELQADFFKLHAGEAFKTPRRNDSMSLSEEDVARIASIVELNMYSNDTYISPCREIKNGSGFWLMPSYINHSCVDNNCCRFFIGTFMFVMTIRKVNKDEQLLHGYCSQLEYFEERDRLFREGHGFVCQCRLCQFERGDSKENLEKLRVIKELSDKLHKAAPCPMLIKQLEGLLDKAREIRPLLELNPVAVKLSFYLCQLYVIPQFKAYARAEPLLQECYEALMATGNLEGALVYPTKVLRVVPQKNRRKFFTDWPKKLKRLSLIWPGDAQLFGMLMEAVGDD